MTNYKRMLILAPLWLFVAAWFTACNPIQVPLITVTPEPTIAFPVQRPVEGERETAEEAIRGQLLLENNCPVIKRYSDNANYAVLWAPGFTVDNGPHGVRVRNEEGQVIARVGDEVYVGGNGDSSARYFTRLMDEPIPEACPPPYWLLGEWGESLTTYAFETGEIYMVRHKPTTTHHVPDQSVLSGQLLLMEGCIQIEAQETGTDYLLLWPPDFAIQEQAGELHLVDGGGTTIAQMGETVQLRGGEATVASTNMSEALLAERCNGPFWEVSEVVVP